MTADRFVSAFFEAVSHIFNGEFECWGNEGRAGSESSSFFELVDKVTVFDMTSGGGSHKDVERGGKANASFLLIESSGADALLSPFVV